MSSTPKLIKGIEVEDNIINMLLPELKQGLTICNKLIKEEVTSENKGLPNITEKPNLLSYFHKLKGSAGFVGFSEIEELSRKLEVFIRNDDIEYKNAVINLRSELTNLLNEIELARKEN